MFKSYRVRHIDGTRGRVMARDGEYLRICFRENGKDEIIEVRESVARGVWIRDLV